MEPIEDLTNSHSGVVIQETFRIPKILPIEITLMTAYDTDRYDCYVEYVVRPDIFDFEIIYWKFKVVASSESLGKFRWFLVFRRRWKDH